MRNICYFVNTRLEKVVLEKAYTMVAKGACGHTTITVARNTSYKVNNNSINDEV